MYKEIFDGPTVDLMDMLEARERRAQRQQAILGNASEPHALISICLNIPGPVKTSALLEDLFKEVLGVILEGQVKESLLDQAVYLEDTGPEALVLVGREPEAVKRSMLAVEESHPYGRLLDIDVIWQDQEGLHSISRTDLGYPRRRCLVCDGDAKECGRSRRHSMEDMYAAIEAIINNGKER